MPLTGNPVKDIYQRILNLPNVISGTLQKVKDGAGDDTALSLSSTKVSVSALDFDTAPALLTSGTQPALVLDGLTVKRRTVYPFGFAEKDPFDAYLEQTDSTSTYSAPDNTPTLIVNNQSVIVGKDAIDFSTSDAFDPATHTYLHSIVDSRDVFQLVLEVNVTPASGWTTGDWVEIGLEFDGSGAATNGIKYYTMPKGASVEHQLTYEHTFVVNSDIVDHGVRVFIKSIGSDCTVDGGKATLVRLMKA